MSCVLPHTTIFTKKGPKAIEHLRPGDILLPGVVSDQQREVAADTLDALRSTAASDALEAHDFGACIVTDQDEWSHDGIYWSKRIYGDTEGGERFCASFGVQFDGKNSAQVIDQWCENISTHRP